VHRTIGCRPIDRLEADRAAMLTLPPVAPTTGWSFRSRLPRDHYVRLHANDYSVHPGAIGRIVEVSADLERVKVSCEGRVVADHARSWAHHQSITDPEHVRAAEKLRRDRAAFKPRPGDAEVEIRALSDYDRLSGEVA
jgi:hypothetical protein